MHHGKWGILKFVKTTSNVSPQAPSILITHDKGDEPNKKENLAWIKYFNSKKPSLLSVKTGKMKVQLAGV